MIALAAAIGGVVCGVLFTVFIIRRLNRKFCRAFIAATLHSAQRGFGAGNAHVELFLDQYWRRCVAPAETLLTQDQLEMDFVDSLDDDTTNVFNCSVGTITACRMIYGDAATEEALATLRRTWLTIQARGRQYENTML